MYSCRRLSLVLMMLFLYVGTLMAQTTISGTVVSADDNEPLMGVSILVEGTKNKTITNLDGKFTIPDVKPNAVLVVSMIGMRTERLKAKNGMHIVMKSEDVQMAEVVVTGQQQIDKRLFTGATTKISAEETKLDGVADINIWTGVDPKDKDLADYELGTSTGIILSDGTSGYIDRHQGIERSFNEDRDYYYPIPTKERQLYHEKGVDLKQNPGWVDGLSY